jgi:hypothetical protein
VTTLIFVVIVALSGDMRKTMLIVHWLSVDLRGDRA